MAATIVDYEGLKTAIETFRERAGDTVITANADDMILLCETRLNRMLRNLNRLVTVTTLTGTISIRNIALPSDYREPIQAYLTSYGNYSCLKKDSPRTLAKTTTNGPPSAWAIISSNLVLDRPCDIAHTIEFTYRAKFDLASTDTNWLLDEHPDVYLNGALMWSGLLLKDEDVAVWKGLMDEALADIRKQDAMSGGVATLSVDPALATSGRYDIYADE